MQIVVRRGSGENSITFSDDGKSSKIDLSKVKAGSGLPKDCPEGMTGRPLLPFELRQLVVNAWCIANGHEPMYVPGPCLTSKVAA